MGGKRYIPPLEGKHGLCPPGAAPTLLDMEPKRLPWQRPTESPWAEAAEVAAVLTKAGYEAVFVGGCVRDHLLGQPCHDCDLATNASPDEVEALFPLTVAVGKAFGVIIVVHQGLNIEVASFRHDGAYIDGRRPEGVQPGDEVGDMQRRDFTINALVADPVKQEVRDHVGGIADLEHKVLRVVGDAEQRLREDRLRVLRAIRFAARYDLHIAAETVQALHTVKPVHLSRERIWEEWAKSLKTPSSRQRWWKLLTDFELIPFLIPHADLASADRVADALQQLISTDAETAQCLILWVMSPNHNDLDRWLRNEPLSKQQRQTFMAVHQQLSQHLAGPDTLHLKRLAREPDAQSVQACLRALNLSTAAQRLADSMVEEAKRGPIPRLLTGADLQGLGVKPGPGFAELIRRAEDAWLMEEISSRGQALAQATQWAQHLEQLAQQDQSG